jgi:cobyrinic acid a,c-diamide synthase
VAADARMTDRLTLGYRRATPGVDNPVAPVGAELRGHEFHYSTCEPAGDGLGWRGREGEGRTGFASPSLLASYLHLHLGGDPSPAERFVAVASSHRSTAAANGSGSSSQGR